MRRECASMPKAEWHDGDILMVAYHFNKKCFSIRSYTSRRVIGYVDSIVLSRVRFHVIPSGRARVLRECIKNVHAFVIGEYRKEFQGSEATREYNLREAYYNPYKVSCFVDIATFEPLYEAQIAVCDKKKVFYV